MGRKRASLSDNKKERKKSKKWEKKEKKLKKKKEKSYGSVSNLKKDEETTESSKTYIQPCNKVIGAMTKEQYEKERNRLKRVYDPETGRNRLTKGDGEIVEEIVSKKRQREINKMATSQDGLFYMETCKYLALKK